MASDTLVFIPAWNEEASLPDVLEEARRDLPDVDLLVIDDGSTDDTSRVAREGGARVVRFDENRGLPVGIATGYRAALDGGYQYCGRLDADGQHPAADSRACSSACAPATATSPSARASCPSRARRRAATSRRSSASWARRCCACSCGCAWARRSRTPRAASTRWTVRRWLCSRTPTCPRRPRSRRSCASPAPTCGCSRSRCTCASASTGARRSPAAAPRTGGVDRAHAVRGRVAAPSLPAPGEEEAEASAAEAAEARLTSHDPSASPAMPPA